MDLGNNRKEKVKNKYDMRGNLYDQKRVKNVKGKILTNLDRKLVKDLLPAYKKGMSVKEVGAGTGRFTVPILKEGYTIKATDINEKLLEGLKNKLGKHDLEDKCRVTKENMFNMREKDELLDVIISIHVVPRLLSLKDQKEMISEVYKKIKKGGVFIFNFRNRLSVPGAFTRDYTPTYYNFKSMLKEVGFYTEEEKSKFIICRRLIDKVPVKYSKLLSKIEYKYSRLIPSLSWDIFVKARKPMNDKSNSIQ